jgi:hypothetical protein
VPPAPARTGPASADRRAELNQLVLQRAFEPEVGLGVAVVVGDLAVTAGSVEADRLGEVIGGVEADSGAAVAAGDRLQLGQQLARNASAAVSGRHVHALHLGHVGIEVADPAEPGRLVVDLDQEKDAGGGRQVTRWAGGDLCLEVDSQGCVGLADEIRVEGRHRRIVGGGGFELRVPHKATLMSIRFHQV